MIIGSATKSEGKDAVTNSNEGKCWCSLTTFYGYHYCWLKKVNFLTETIERNFKDDCPSLKYWWFVFYIRSEIQVLFYGELFVEKSVVDIDVFLLIFRWIFLVRTVTTNVVDKNNSPWPTAEEILGNPIVRDDGPGRRSRCSILSPKETK